MRLLIILSLFWILACKSEKKPGKTVPIPEKNSCRQNLEFINMRLKMVESELDSMKKLNGDPDSQKRLEIKDILFQILKRKREEIQKNCDTLKYLAPIAFVPTGISLPA
jgi:hypothetical protein